MAQILLAAVAALAYVGTTAADSCTAGDVTAGALNVPGSSPAGCVCPSGQYFDSSSCVANPACTLPLPWTTNTTFDSSGISLTTVDMSGTDSIVTFSLSMPTPTETLVYKNFYITSETSPGGVPLAGCDVTKFQSVSEPNPGACTDTFQFRAAFADLQACGFQLSSDNIPASTFQTYDGTIRIAYDATVQLGTDTFATNQTRTASVDYPVRIKFQSEYTSELSLANVTVFANQQIDFAITDQTIPQSGAGNPTLKFAYTTQYPYAITSFTSTLTPTTGTITAELTSSATTCATPADYSASSVPADATCTKIDNLVTFTVPAGVCQFSGYSYTLDYSVQCGTGVAAADCPLQSADAGSAVFTITSEDFCTGNATPNTINNVIDITDFYATSTDASTTQQNAFQFNTDAPFYMTFTGLALNTCKLYKLQRQYDAENTWTDVSTATDQTQSITLNGFSDSTGNLGLGVDKASYRFKLTMNQDLLGVSSVARGTNPLLQLRAYIDVTYSNTRRRRQAASASGQGYADSKPTGIQSADTAEAAPNSAVRAAPVLAVALGLLSAVLIA